MTRIVDTHFTVHYAHPAKGNLTLCGDYAATATDDLFGNKDWKPWPYTANPVTCVKCAAVVCAVRNEPYNTIIADITEDALSAGILGAVTGIYETEEA